MDGYAPGDPLVALPIEELATVKPALPSVLTHSGALESNSLFCTVYVPPDTGAVCCWHSDVVTAAAGLAVSAGGGPPGLMARAARKVPRASSKGGAMGGADLERVTGYLRAQRPGPGGPRSAFRGRCLLVTSAYCARYSALIVASAAAGGQERSYYAPLSIVTAGELADLAEVAAGSGTGSGQCGAYALTGWWTSGKGSL